jgi:hypothetical protein
MAETVTSLTDTILEQLQHETFVILNTIDHESGRITSNAISWITAMSAERIRIAVDQRSRLITNMKANEQVTLSLFAAGSFYSIQGRATIVQERMEEVPIKLSCIDIEVIEVREAMFYGSRITVNPEFEKTYDKRAADKLDGQVFAAMKKA